MSTLVKFGTGGGALPAAPAPMQAPSGEFSAKRFLESSGMRLGRNAQMRDPGYLVRLAEAEEFLNAFVAGRVTQERFVEAMTRSDFPLLLGNNLHRKLIGFYEGFPTTYQNWCMTDTVKDFRIHDRNMLNAASGLLTKVAERVPGPERAYAEARWQTQVFVYEDFMDFSWEMFVDDDLRAFRNAPRDLGFAAKRTEEYLATTLAFDANGPHASFFTAGNNNIVNILNGAHLNNPPISAQAIKDGYSILLKQKDSEGLPVMIQGAHLLYGPALHVTVMDLLKGNLITIMNEDRASSKNVGQNLHTSNWLLSALQPQLLSMLPYVASSANGDTSWALVADPYKSSRPAFEFDRLQGFEQPGLFRKKSDMEPVSGGADEALLMTSFEGRNIRHKVVHVIGGAQADPRMAVGSNGSGS